MGREALFRVRLFSPRILKPGRRAEGRGRAREDRAPETGKAPRVFSRDIASPGGAMPFFELRKNGGCTSRLLEREGFPGIRESGDP